MIDYFDLGSQLDGAQGTLELSPVDLSGAEGNVLNDHSQGVDSHLQPLDFLVNPMEMLVDPGTNDDPPPDCNIGDNYVGVPAGYFAEDYVGVDLYIDPYSGELSMTLMFQHDDPTTAAGAAPSDGGGDPLGSLVEHNNNIDQATTVCHVTITRTVTQTSGASSITGNIGVVGGSRSGGTTTTTTTTSVTLTGVQVNGHCYIPRGR